jgi:hypothetical protein
MKPGNDLHVARLRLSAGCVSLCVSYFATSRPTLRRRTWRRRLHEFHASVAEWEKPRPRRVLRAKVRDRVRTIELH